jgi:hypothetical protein
MPWLPLSPFDGITNRQAFSRVYDYHVFFVSSMLLCGVKPMFSNPSPTSPSSLVDCCFGM